MFLVRSIRLLGVLFAGVTLKLFALGRQGNQAWLNAWNAGADLNQMKATGTPEQRGTDGHPTEG
jgi:hypothetical protein